MRTALAERREYARHLIRKIVGWSATLGRRLSGLERWKKLMALEAAFALALALLSHLTGAHLYRNLFWPALEKTPEVQAWSARVYAAIFVLGVPVALMLWHWRDSNVRAQIAVSRDEYENRRKDTNLKEFQEVQLRASGALDEKLPAEAREQLQIAALHQLRGFLRGEYGEDFRRPAFELLLAGHAAAMERIGHLKAIESWSPGDWPEVEKRREIGSIIATVKSRLPPVDRERLGILRDEAEFIVGVRGRYRDGNSFPLNGRCFDLIDLSNRAISASQSFARCSFVGAKLWCADLKGVALKGANLAGANLSHANLEGANLSDASLAGAYLTEARLEGTNLSDAHLTGAVLNDATFDAATSLTANWPVLSEPEREALRQALIGRGAVRSDLALAPAPPPVPDTGADSR